MTGSELLNRIPMEEWDATPASVQRLLLSLLPMAMEVEALRSRLQALEQHPQASVTVLERYHLLVDQLFLRGLSEEEQAEMERLGAEIDTQNAPFYEVALRKMQTAGKRQE